MTGKKSQSQKFKDLAREIEADEDEEAFAEKLRKIAEQKPDKGNKEKTDGE